MDKADEEELHALIIDRDEERRREQIAVLLFVLAIVV